MHEVIADLAQHWPLYAAIPFVAAVIGYVTKRVAIEMMFRPLEFKGIPGTRIGWQGVVPQHGGRMAAIATDLLTSNLVDLGEIVGRIDPDRLVAEIEQPLLRAIDETAREILREHYPRLWQSMPELGRDMVVKQLQSTAPRLVRKLTEDLRTNVHEVIDIKHMSVSKLTEDRALLVRLIRETSRPEMRFIARTGIYFGFVLGILQASIWAVTKEPLVLPIFGGCIGLLTDWLAIKLIFVPREPVRLPRGHILQGKFQRRRAEVSHQYGELIARDVLTVSNLVDAIVTGPRSDRTRAMIHSMVAEAVDQQARLARPLIGPAAGEPRLAAVKQAATTRAVNVLEGTIHPASGYLTEAMDVANIVEQRMLELTPVQFEQLLRPAFRQDEWKLITVGGVIGFVVGELQVLLMLH